MILLILLCIILILDYIVRIVKYIVWYTKYTVLIVNSKQFWSLLIGYSITVIRNRILKFIEYISTKQVSLWYSFISGIGIFIVLFLFLISIGIIQSNDDMKGLAGNLLAECLGIGLTVLIIDRLIKRREEMRLLEAKQIVNARLLLIIDHLLETMSQLFPGDYCKSRHNTYMYSRTPIASNMEFDNLSTLRRSILEYVKQLVEEQASIQVSTDYTSIMRPNIYNATLLSTALDQIHHIQAGSSFLIEPKLVSLLLQFDLDCATLKRLTDVAEKYPIPTNKTGRLVYEALLIDYIEKIMKKVVNVRELLISRADRHFTQESFAS